MTSPVSDEFYYDGVFIDGLNDKYTFPTKQTPLSSMVKYYFNYSEGKYAKHRFYRACWIIRNNKLYFNMLQILKTKKILNFTQVFLNDINKREDPWLVLAEWYTGVLMIDVETDYNHFKDGEIWNKKIFRSYLIERGIVIEWHEEYEFSVPPPF